MSDDEAIKKLIGKYVEISPMSSNTKEVVGKLQHINSDWITLQPVGSCEFDYRKGILRLEYITNFDQIFIQRHNILGIRIVHDPNNIEAKMYNLLEKLKKEDSGKGI